MKDNENIMKRLNQIKLPRVFRQNVLIIFIFSLVVTVLYYSFFLFNRSKQIGKVLNLKRRYFYLITPFIGIFTMFAVSSVLVIIISNKENIPLGELTSIKNLLDIIVSEKYPQYTIVTHISYIFALLCFVVPLSDLLIQLSEKMKQIKTVFPKIIANTPAIFTIVGLTNILLQVTEISDTAYFSGVYILANTIFVMTIVLSHIYLANVYVLFTAIKLPIHKGEN